MKRVAVVIVVGLVTLGACGSSKPDVSKPASRLLHAQVDAVRRAAAGLDRAATTEQLAGLRTSVAQLRARGEITRDAATRIRRAADAVAAQLTLIPLPTTTTTTLPPPPDEHGRGKEGHGPGQEKHGGRDRADEND